MKKILAAVAFATLIASPAFAQSFDPEAGTGNVVPFSAPFSAPSSFRPTIHQNKRYSADQNGLSAYAMVPAAVAGRNSNDPALTGGGSLGYNTNIYNW